MNCPNCDKEIDKNFKFCPYCAAPIVTSESTCPHCGSMNLPADSRFCPDCGFKIGEASVFGEQKRLFEDFDVLWIFSEGLAPARKTKDSSWCYVDKYGEIIIEGNLWTEAMPFHEGFAQVIYNKKTSLFLSKEKYINSPLSPYKYHSDFIAEGFAPVRTSSGCGFLNLHDGSFVGDYEDVQFFSEGLAGVKVNELWGFIDVCGEIVIPCIYEEVCPFHEGVAIVNKDFKETLVINTDGDVLSDMSGKYFYPHEEQSYFVDGFSVLEGLDGYRIVDVDGSTFEDTYDDAIGFSNGLAGICINKKWGFVNKYNEIIIPVVYNEVLPFNEGFAPVRKDNKWGLLDLRGNVVAEIIYDKIYKFQDGVATFRKDGKVGYLDQYGVPHY